MKIPVYDEPQVAPASLPGARVEGSTENGLGALGQGIERLSAGVGEAVQREKEKADAVATGGADSAFQQANDDMLVGKIIAAQHSQPSAPGTPAAPPGPAPSPATPAAPPGPAPSPADSKPGILSSQGQNAFDASDGYLDRLKKKQQEIAKGLTPDQQRVFLQHSGQVIQNTQQRVEMHLARQRDVAVSDGIDDTFRSGLSSVANAPDDPVGAAIHARARLEGLLRQSGVSEPGIHARLGEFDQQAAQAMLRPLLTKDNPTSADAAQATKLLDAPYAPGPDGKMLTVRSALGTSAPDYVKGVDLLQGKVGGDSDAIAALNGARRDNGSIDEAKLTATLEKMPAAKKTPAFEQPLGKYLSLERGAWADKTSQNFNDALGAFQRNHSLADVPPATEAWMRANDPVGWGHLEDTARNWGVKDQRNDPKLTGNYVSLLADMADNPFKYRAMSPAEFNALAAPLLSAPDFKEAGQKFAEIRTKPEFDVKLVGEPAQQVSNSFREAFGINPKTPESAWTPQQQAMWRTVHDYVQQKATEATIREKKRPDLEQLAAWANEKLHKVHITGSGIYGFFGSDEPQVQADAEGKAYDGAPPATAPIATQSSQRAPATLDDAQTTAAPDAGTSALAAKLHAEARVAGLAPVPDDARQALLEIAAKQGNPNPTERQIRIAYQRAKAAGAFK